MKVVLFGGSGFIGRHLASSLMASGKDVSVFSRSRIDMPGATLMQGCITDRAAVAAAVKGADVVYNLVNGGVPASADCIQQIQFDLVGNVNILECMREAGVKRLIYVSSGGAVYGDPDVLPIPESHPIRPKSSYGVVKASAEMYCRLHSEQGGLITSIVRPSNAYGPGQNLDKPQGVIAHFIKRFLKGESLQVWGDGNAVKDYIYVADLVEFLVKLTEAERSETYNVGSGSAVSVNEILGILAKITGLPAKVEYQPGVPGDVQRYVLDISKAEEDFDWVPRVSFEDGVRFQYQCALEDAKSAS